MADVITDRVEESVVVDAPPDRVWRDLADPPTLGRFLDIEITTPEFTAGAGVKGRLSHPPREGSSVELVVETVDRPRILSWHWHPFALDIQVDYSNEPMTLVILELQPLGTGATKLTLVETGFDRLPPARRDVALTARRTAWHEVLRRVRAAAA